MRKKELRKQYDQERVQEEVVQVEAESESSSSSSSSSSVTDLLGEEEDAVVTQEDFVPGTPATLTLSQQSSNQMEEQPATIVITPPTPPISRKSTPPPSVSSDSPRPTTPRPTTGVARRPSIGLKQPRSSFFSQTPPPSPHPRTSVRKLHKPPAVTPQQFALRSKSGGGGDVLDESTTRDHLIENEDSPPTSKKGTIK